MKNISLILTLLFSFTYFPTFSQESLPANKQMAQGLYIGGILPYQSTQGDLNGNSFLHTSREVFLVPQVDPGWGWGISVGWRAGNLALEVNYQRTQHEITFQSADGKASLTSLSFDYKVFFLNDRNVQPFVYLGWVPGMTLRMEDASASISTNPEVRDAQLRGGIGATRLGMGILFVPSSRIFIQGEVNYRFSKYTAVAGGKDFVGARIEEPLKGNGLNASLGLSYVLFR